MNRAPLSELPETAEAVVEVPRGGRVKRRLGGGVDYVSPLPSPFNYGAIPDRIAADGEGVDAVILGPRLPPGHRVRLPVCGRVRFVDGGGVDDKWVLAAAPPDAGERRRVLRFFRRYARIKRWLARLRGRPTGGVRFEGVEWR